MEITSAAIAFTGLIIGWTMHIAALVWWLSRQFSETRALVYDRAEKTAAMLREHERDDVERFSVLERELATLQGRRANGR
jgi:hypothetical protein